MTKVSELQFEIAGCCGTHESATVEREDGVTVGIIRGEEGMYSVSLYNSEGLIGRESPVNEERVDQILNT